MRTALVVLLCALLSGCALHKKPGAAVVPPGCSLTECGDLCCNDDGKVCPPCWKGVIR